MAQEIADSKLIDTWSSSGTKIEPDISKIIEGWQLGEQPPHEYMNWLQNTFGSKLNHILKNGIAEWNNETEYLSGSSVQHSGNVWICEITNINSEPIDLNENWGKVAINKNLTVPVDTLADLKNISYPANTVWASGYHTKNDGAFGSHIFRLKGVKTTETDNSGTVIVATIGGTDYVYELQFERVYTCYFGAVGDGIVDDTLSTQAALLNYKNVYKKAGTFKITSTLIMQPYSSLKGIHRELTILSHEFNGDLIHMPNSSELDDIYLKGNGATYTGKGILITSNSSKQKVNKLRIIDFDDACIEFEDNNSGSQSEFNSIEMNRINAGTTTERYAVIIPSTQQLTAKPRKFSNIETNGSCSFDFGGSNNTYVNNSFLGDIKFNDESRGVLIGNTRIANQLSLTIKGHQNSIVGSDINPQITIGSESDSIALQGNSYNNLPVIDNSLNDRNTIDTYTVVYTCSITSSGADFVIGNGIVVSKYSRHGASITVDISLTIGSTTVMGTGYLKFSIPLKTVGSAIQSCGQAIMTIGGITYSSIAQIPGIVDFIRLQRDTSGLVSSTSPALFVSGDTIKISSTYLI